MPRMKKTGKAYKSGLIILPSFFFKNARYRKTIIIASKPRANAPVRPMTEINSLRPRKNKSSGAKQAINQDNLGDKLKSYQSVFFNVRPRVIKEVKVVITPKRKPSLMILLPKVLDNPEIASLEVSKPEAPKTIKI